MRHILRTLVMIGSLAASASLANAQTVTLLDSLKSGEQLGNQVTDATAAIGYDSGQGVSNPPVQGEVPALKTQAGYVVVPFALGGSGVYDVSRVQFEGAIVAPQDPTITQTNNLYGAFVQAPSGASINANAGKIVGGFFQFTIGAPTGNNTILTANIAAGSQPVLTAGQNYWLVLAPKNGVAAQSSDPILAYGQANIYDAESLPAGASLNGIATEKQALWEAGPQGGANPGDMLQSALSNNGDGTLPGYVPVRILASAGVPETSTLLTALLGLAPIGSLLARRRAN